MPVLRRNHEKLRSDIRALYSVNRVKHINTTYGTANFDAADMPVKAGRHRLVQSLRSVVMKTLTNAVLHDVTTRRQRFRTEVFIIITHVSTSNFS